MAPAKLPRIALDADQPFAGEVALGGHVYPVTHVTSKAYRGSKKLQDDEAERLALVKEEGISKAVAVARIPYDLALIFEMARSLCPSMPNEVADSLTPEQAVAIMAVAQGAIAEVEALFPKAKGGASPRKGSPR